MAVTWARAEPGVCGDSVTDATLTTGGVPSTTSVLVLVVRTDRAGSHGSGSSAIDTAHRPSGRFDRVTD